MSEIEREPSNPARDLGAKMAQALTMFEDRHAAAAAVARQRLLSSSEGPGRSQSYRRLVVLAAACCALAGLAALLLVRSPVPLSFLVDGASLEAAQFIAAPPGRSVAVVFSDGTRVDLQPESALRVLDRNSRGARILLERGRVRAAVRHLPLSSWQIIAGPFAVDVVGTVLDVNWDPVEERLSVAVTEGRVVVSGGAVGEREVRGGQTLRVQLGEARVCMDGDSAPAPSCGLGPDMAPRPSEDPPVAPSPSATASTASAVPFKSPEPPVVPPPGPSWQRLADSGKFQEAMAAAEAANFDVQCGHATSADLLVLGDVARLAGKPAYARRALLSLRQRFPGDPRAAVAAFMLGKIAVEKLGDAQQGTDWLRTAIREQPNGALVREAQGRLIEALRKQGDVPGARTAAREYLDRYPTGPHAGVAQAVLSE